MTDLNKLLRQTQRAETTHIDACNRRGIATSQWFLENDIRSHPIHNNNQLQFFICGEEGFAAIEQDIRKAKRSIDLVCWGFDPGMETMRMTATTDPKVTGYGFWPRGATYGDLLVEKAQQGVKVRLLLWYDPPALHAAAAAGLYAGKLKALAAQQLLVAVKSYFVHKGAGNAPDLPLVWSPASIHHTRPATPPMQTRNAKATTPGQRSQYCEAWWKAALSGAIPNLEVRFRDGDTVAIRAQQQHYLPDSVTLSEELTMQLVGTHHQKPILIDYDPGPARPGAGNDNPKTHATPANTCGYVMGLNSVSAYWDTTQHLYNDPRRETAYNVGAFWLKPWHAKPYRDYAIRVEGEALACLNKNFCTAWDKAQGTHLHLPGPKLVATRAAVTPPPKGAHRAQIVRTQPEEEDATILKTYVQAASNAINYLYVENQYVQLSDWVRYLKTLRRQHSDFACKAQAAPGSIAPLHLMVVMPQPERSQMVPSTYDTLAHMGQGTTVRGYHQQVQDTRDGKELGDTTALARANIKASIDSTPVNITQELKNLNIKTLVAMLMTYDHKNEARNIRINARDNDAQEAQAKQEAQAAANEAKTTVHQRPSYEQSFTPKNQGYNITPQRYREIYIHSKLMLIDDAFLTLGSANLNARSMVADSELNIACADHRFAKDARKRVWGNLAGTDLDGGDGSVKVTGDVFEKWIKRMSKNAQDRSKSDHGTGPENDSFIHTFDDPRTAPNIRLG